MKSDKNEAMLTTADVAKRLRRSQRYVRDLCKCGKLRWVKLADAGPYLIHPESVDALLGIRAKQVRLSEDALLEKVARGRSLIAAMQFPKRDRRGPGRKSG